MRVFSFEPLGAFGGMGIYDRSFHTALARHGSLDVIWVTADGGADRSMGDDTSALYDTWTPFKRVFGAGSLAGQGIRYARGLATLVNRAAREARHRPVVVHQQFLAVPLLELVAMRTAQQLGVPWVVTPHEALPYSGSRRDALVRRRIFAGADALIALSEANRAELAQLARVRPAQIVLTPLGHLNDYRGEQAQLEAQTARARLGLSSDAPIVLFLGEMRPIKGLQHLLRAMCVVLRAVPEAHLVIAGRPYRFDAGGPENLIDALGIRHAVTARWGFVPESDLGLYLRAADVVALPYLAASQSAACLTAYAFGRPVVASSVGGLAEQVQDGVTGLLVPPANADALGEALIRLLRRREDAHVMGIAAHAWAARERPWEPIARATARAYRDAWSMRHTE